MVSGPVHGRSLGVRVQGNPVRGSVPSLTPGNYRVRVTLSNSSKS